MLLLIPYLTRDPGSILASFEKDIFPFLLTQITNSSTYLIFKLLNMSLIFVTVSPLMGAC